MVHAGVEIEFSTAQHNPDFDLYVVEAWLKDNPNFKATTTCTKKKIRAAKRKLKYNLTHRKS